MLGSYGWISAFDDIDHPDMAKTAGRIYVHRRDVAKGVTLAQGDTVSFYLYADSQGLGAEVCQLEKNAPPSSEDNGEAHQSTAHGFRADAVVDVTNDACALFSWNAHAAAFAPPATATIPSCFRAQALDFFPSQCSAMNAGAVQFEPSAMSRVATFAPTIGGSNMLFNLDAFLSDDESDSESWFASNEDTSGNDGDMESNDSDEESTRGENIQPLQQNTDIEWSSHLDASVLFTRLKSPRASSGDDSTSVGASSDSEQEEEDEATRFSALLHRLSFPKGLRAPPGLSLPVLGA